MKDRAKEIFESLLSRTKAQCPGLRSSQVRAALCSVAIEFDDLETRIAEMDNRLEALEEYDG